MSTRKKYTLGVLLLIAICSIFMLVKQADGIEIAPGLMVRQATMGGGYVMFDRPQEKKIVKDVKGWVITPRYALGSAGRTDYFAYDRSCKTSQIFNSIGEFAIWLRTVNETYEYSNEEGPADIFLDKKNPRFHDLPINSQCLQTEASSQ